MNESMRANDDSARLKFLIQFCPQKCFIPSLAWYVGKHFTLQAINIIEPFNGRQNNSRNGNSCFVCFVSISP